MKNVTEKERKQSRKQWDTTMNIKNKNAVVRL